METCVVRWSLWRNGVVALIGLGFSVLSMPALMDGAKELHESLLGSVVFFGFIGVLFGYRALYRKPVLIIDDRGINLSRCGLIPWDDIDKVGLVALGQMSVFVIFPKQPEVWRSRLPVVYKILRRILSKRQGWDSTMPLSLQNVDAPMLAIFNAIKTRLPHQSTESRLVMFSRGDS